MKSKQSRRGGRAFISAFAVCLGAFGALMVLTLCFIAPALAPAPEPDAEKAAAYPSSDSFTVLSCVHNGDAAVALFLYRVDAARGRTVVLPVPADLSSEAAGVVSLGEVYSNGGADQVRDALETLLSIKIDFTCDVGADDFMRVFDALGGLYSEVPRDFSFALPGGGSVSLVSSPRQYLSSQKLYALLCCPELDAGGREKVQSELMTAFVRQKLTDDYLGDVDLCGQIFNYLTTDFSYNDLLYRGAAISGFSSRVVSPLPGLSVGAGGLLQFSRPGDVAAYFS